MIALHAFIQMRPSRYMHDISLDTEKKLATQHTVNVPKQLELLYMSEVSHYRVENKLYVLTEAWRI